MKAAEVAQKLLDLNRKRDTLLGNGLLGSPAWDILLLLYTNQGKSSSPTLLETVKALGVHESTGKRCIRALEQKGFLGRARVDDFVDGIEVELTAFGTKALNDIFAS